jgi:hypothetical protein
MYTDNGQPTGILFGIDLASKRVIGNKPNLDQGRAIDRHRLLYYLVVFGKLDDHH